MDEVVLERQLFPKTLTQVIEIAACLPVLVRVRNFIKRTVDHLAELSTCLTFRETVPTKRHTQFYYAR